MNENDLLKKKFSFEVELIKEITDLDFSKFEDYKKELISEIVRRSYEYKSSIMGKSKLLSEFDTSKPTQTMLTETIDRLTKNIVDKSKNDKMLSESLINKNVSKKTMLTEYFIGSPTKEDGIQSLQKLVLESLIDSLVELD
jgi:hypothetical protein